jgi:hypothetical protein
MTKTMSAAKINNPYTIGTRIDITVARAPTKKIAILCIHSNSLSDACHKN